MEQDPKQRVAISCFTCIKGMDLSKQYGISKITIEFDESTDENNANDENVVSNEKIFISNEDAFEEAVSRISRGMYVKMAARYQGQAATSGMVYNEKTYTVILFY